MTYWQDVEKKWQHRWDERGLFRPKPDDRPKKTITVAYPYPNSPQHMGHGRTYTLADINARFWRMRGYNVLFPMGFHYTGTPILGMARRVQARDEELLSGLRDMFGVPPHVIESFVKPLNIANYFRTEIKTGMMEMGYSIDWRREFTTIDEPYRRFVEWQVNFLRERGLIIQGSHPVGWCPRDQNPVSQHDTLGDVEPEFTEYVLVKFRWGRYTIVAATLRPETIFGVTNVWINPDVTYDIVRVDDEEWIVSPQCTYKLSFQDIKAEKLGTLKGAQMVGKRIQTPLNVDVPMLPAGFADPNTGTGLVMSVPAHAPFDYMALQDISDTLQEAQGIRAIPVIDVPGYGKVPAQEACQAHGIKNQHDPKLDEVTSDIYNKEFYTGTLLESCGKFSGMRVSECKDAIRDWLLENNHGGEFLEMADDVRCRCGTICVVKILSNQWFLNYGSDDWKQDTRDCMGEMDILPPEIRPEFGNVVDWLRERACARQHGMGTKLPWDDNWIVESLSDSTIYSAFYIIMKFVTDKSLSADMMDEKFFDYVFLGMGPRPDIPNIDEIRREFLYFYPVDTRHSGRDLVPNHLTFYVMNHVAIFPRNLWPRQIVVNGSVLMGGKKMSKSMGNIIPLRRAIEKYGADPIRLGITISAELLQDADINLDSVSGMGQRLERIIRECSGLERGSSENTGMPERWLLARVHALVERVTGNMERMRMREALHDILYGLESDMQWYRQRLAGAAPPPGIKHMICSTRAALLSPFAPHAAEEMWLALGNSGLVAEASWPTGTGTDDSVLQAEHLLRSILADISHIVSISKITPRRIMVYVADWHHIYLEVLRCVDAGHTRMRDVMAALGDNPKTADLRRRPKEITRCLKDILSEPVDMRRYRLNDVSFDERNLLENHLQDVVNTTFQGAEVVVYDNVESPDDPGNKAHTARPFKPALFIT